MNAINEKIKELRIKSGVKQADVARSAGIKQSSYASIEKGDTKSISIEVGKGIAQALGISFNDLFEIESNSDLKIKSLTEEIEQLKKENSYLKEQLKDKRTIIEFLSDNNLLIALARELYIKENPDEMFKQRDFNDIDKLIKEIEDHPYDISSKESLLNYILPRIKNFK